jgi:hypothetical protein
LGLSLSSNFADPASQTGSAVILSFKCILTEFLKNRGAPTSYNTVEEREKAKALIEGYKRLKDVALTRAQAMYDIKQAVEDLRGDLKRVRALLTTRNSKGGLLVSLGLACLAFPEPVVSNIAGAALIALGRLLERRGASIKDLAEAFKEARSILSA